MKVYTDGGCINNGRYNAKAAFAVCFEKGMPYTALYGLLKPNKYILNKNEAIKNTTDIISPTNIRAEMFAVIMALYAIKKHKGSCDIEIVTDSEFTINVLTKWIDDWFKTGKILKKANPDLLLILHYLYHYHRVVLTHQNSHVDLKKNNTPNAIGNDYVDKLVTNAIKTLKNYSILTKL